MERWFVLGCAALAGFFALHALLEITAFGWPQPMFDQFRLYETYLTLPFPANAWQLENGHRPILPALVRLAEIRWFGGGQALQLVVGAGAAFLTAGMLGLVGALQPGLTPARRAAAGLAGVALVLWMGNARMLLHGHELVHAYLLTAAVVAAQLCLWQAARGSAGRWMAGATLACVVATFCFGPGIASFLAVGCVAVLLRVPWRPLLWPLGGFLACLLLYLGVLPGTDGVREVMAIRPLDNAVAGARWLSSPWINGWLGLADPPLSANLAAAFDGNLAGRALRLSAGAVDAVPGLDWRTSTAALIGFLGLVALAAAVLSRGRRWHDPTRLEVVGLGLAVFAAVTAGVVGTARLAYFQASPEQIFATRYLVWPCLFWLGLAWLALARRGKGRWGAAPAVALCVGLLVPTGLAWGFWGSAMYRSSQQLAAAVRSQVYDAALFPDNADASRATRLRVVELLRERRLAMFRGPAWQQLGQVWNGTLDSESSGSASILEQHAVHDVRDGAVGLHLRGEWQAGNQLPADAELVFVDDQNRVRGFAEWSAVAVVTSPLQWRFGHKRGFDGYVRHARPGQRLRLLALPGHGAKAMYLASVEVTY
ncbi:hypothetical protein [Tahibacter amnicola]|uniref:Glycosyltransferase RgtA/B/C/D-like domain-containing protein n=1 Tax=Tahibacter amnicola TaxID=2976241 RepID=A0ABY6BBT3_9GAMM|nr:hypothetical protein [Tahibacter amnicola]UXI67508.1 hypothetical protein N4264_22665 [Tahibacter amnicola]